MGINFTEEQRQVIELHNCNILVSAAAGSGKTAVLTERIVRMVCDEARPVDIDRLLIVTFTNAAAAEMRERIAEGIAGQIAMHPESEHIQRQAALLHNAQITTIDSFSLFLLRNHFHEIGLDPAFRVADEGEIRLMEQDVLKELLEDAFAGQKEFQDRQEQVQACVEYFCPGGRESVLENHILKLSHYAASFPWPDRWLEERRQDYGKKKSAQTDVAEEWLTESCGVYLQNHIAHMLEGCVQKLREVRKICESPDGPYMYGELVERESELLTEIVKEDSMEISMEVCGQKLSGLVFGRLPTKKDDSVSPLKRELAKKLRSEVKDTLQKLTEKYFAVPFSLAVAREEACALPVNTLLDLVSAFDGRMQERKRDKKVIDFSDMEHYALNIVLKQTGDAGEETQPQEKTCSEAMPDIMPSRVALEYRQYFEEVLIDEYQDSNLVQEYLLKAVSGEEEGHFNRFMVGDVKQSIYKFRLARPELFLEKYKSYGDTGDCRRIDLSRNFRSRSQVVDTVNGIFARIMSEETGGIAYDDKAALYVGAGYPENPDCFSELLLIEKPGKEETEQETAVNGADTQESRGRMTARQAEALAIAAKIKELLVSFQVTDKESGELRPAAYRDMVILLRTGSGWDDVFKKVLDEEGIPVSVTSKTGYFAASEVQELLQLLRVLDNPCQDIPLFGVMKSVFGGFFQEEIALVRAGAKDCFLYEAVKRYAQENENSGEENIREKCRVFLSTLDEYRDLTVYLPIRELLQRIVDDFHYLDYVTALPAGGKRRANVEMLFTKASDFEKTSYFGLFHFVRYMEQLEKYDMDYGEADTLDEHADVVRIMSIHKSKGLEFPIVFVAGLSKRFNLQDAAQSLLVDMDLGLACDYVEPDRRLKNKTLRSKVLSAKLREDTFAEELRILYVALTRAREKLIMSAVLENAAERWELAKALNSDRLSYVDFMEAGSYLDFVLPVLPQVNVEVTLVEAENLRQAEFAEQLGLFDRQAALSQAAGYADGQLLSELRERFSYQYPYQGLEKLYTKTTVSELKIAAMADKDEAAFHAFEEKEVVPYIPAFRREEEKVSGTVRGNAYHRAMELLDFEGLLGELFTAFPEDYEHYRRELNSKRLSERLHTFLKREAEELRLPEEYLAALRESKLLHFLEQEIAWRMWGAQRRGELYREQPFVLGVPASRLIADVQEQEKVLIQGIIDVFFVEEGEVVLLDYKTDVIPSMEALYSRYETQLDYYAEALTRLMQMPIKEKRLYSFYLEV